MAFPQPNSRELQKKIVEKLQLEKQMLLKQGVPPPTSSAANPPPVPATDGPTMTGNQRTALYNAHAASSGYFVTQDSSFGNLILPVLPRFDSK